MPKICFELNGSKYGVYLTEDYINIANSLKDILGDSCKDNFIIIFAIAAAGMNHMVGDNPRVADFMRLRDSLQSSIGLYEEAIASNSDVAEIIGMLYHEWKAMKGLVNMFLQPPRKNERDRMPTVHR